MRHHQKYFSVESGARQLAPHFVAVMNTSGDPEGLVKRGNERVLKPASTMPGSSGMSISTRNWPTASRIWPCHVSGEAGSYLEKTKRVVELVKKLGGNEHAQRAAHPLQGGSHHRNGEGVHRSAGHVGGLYARHQGEPEAVGAGHLRSLQAAEHGGRDSIDSRGQLVALADKLDTLRSCFAIGLVPTGSKDPFALRRAAQGVVKILVEGSSITSSMIWPSGELRDFLARPHQILFPRDSRLQV